MIDISKITWGTILFEPDYLNPEYIGLHEACEASTKDSNWVIYKITGKNKIQMTKGIFDDRKQLFK